MDQSEDEGQIRSSDNFDDDDGTNDSLDIKPPQSRSYKDKKKHKKHHEKRQHKDRYREYPREKEHPERRYSSDNRREYREKYYKEKDYYQKSSRKPSRRSSPEDPVKYENDRREEDLRNRLIRRQQEEGARTSRKDDYYDRSRSRNVDPEAEARRKKFMEADHHDRKRKERARQELEARRREPSPSPERKKQRYLGSDEERKADVVMVSSDHEEEEEEVDSQSDSQSESEEFEMSPISVEKLEKSPAESISSRSRSRDFSNRSSRSRSRSSSSDSRSSSSKSSETESERSYEDKKEEVGETKEVDETKLDESKEELTIIEEEDVLPPYFPALQGCRSVEEFQCLNRIEEGTYGVVYRAKDKRTDEIVALKRLKMEKEKEGFPITSLREINTLLKGQHPNIVTVREIVVGSNMDKIFIVMDYVEHDLKSLMETMKHKKQVFLPGEVKCLIQQLMRAVAHLHDNWILHRDLKTSNLLLSHKGILKVGDFGLAREYGSPLKEYTSVVVTLWYRAPELLLGCREYSTPIDVWSCGCIFAELLAMGPLFPGKSEVDQLNRIFKDLGTPNERVWPGYDQLPLVKKMTFSEYPVSQIRKKFAAQTSELGLSMLQGLLTYDPKQRLTADAALKHSYFKELPLPIDPSMFPT